jgi:hypothetical protein
LSYAYVDFKELNGTDLDKLNFTLHHNDCCDAAHPPPSPDVPIFEEDTVDVNFQKFKLTSNVTRSADLWRDRSLRPELAAAYRVHGHGCAGTGDDQRHIGADVHFFNVATHLTQETRSVSDNHLGVGDLQLRSKYRLEAIAGFGTAVGLNLRFPSGSVDNVQGFGDFTLSPTS